MPAAATAMMTSFYAGFGKGRVDGVSISGPPGSRTSITVIVSGSIGSSSSVFAFTLREDGRAMLG